jgi:integrase/recombinase XerD
VQAVQLEARQVLDAWLDARQDESPALFPTRSGRRLARREGAAIIVRRIDAQANAHLPEKEKIDRSPHVLRHTFLRKLTETRGVLYARGTSGTSPTARFYSASSSTER